MKISNEESVGEKFQNDLLIMARDKTLEVIASAAPQFQIGMTEAEGRALIQKIQMENGAPKSWHPPQIRFGENTLLPFGIVGKGNPILQENDIFFIDIGPIFEGHEGDVGRPFYIGNDQEMGRCCEDAKLIWNEVRNHWQQQQVIGMELYKFAKKSAESRGWILTFEEANGHRIADFPHAAKMRGTIQGLEISPAANRWILEIQIRHPSRSFGAFYEDLLN